MDQTTARRRAKELGGIAIEARPRVTGGWLIGGWPHQKGATWIVVDLLKTQVLDDGSQDVSEDTPTEIKKES